MQVFVSYTFQCHRGTGNGNATMHGKERRQELSWPEVEEIQRNALSELRKAVPDAHSLVVNWWKILREDAA